jgi:hypothetical protein
MDLVLPQIAEELGQVKSVPVSVLLWGESPASSTPLATLRIEMRKELRAEGHAAFTSEELCDSASPYSVRVQQIAQARHFDLIVSIPSSPGSIGEAHDFAADRRSSGKMLICLDKRFTDGYSTKSLDVLRSILTCEIEYYDGASDIGTIRQVVIREVQRIREVKYILAGRY